MQGTAGSLTMKFISEQIWQNCKIFTLEKFRLYSISVMSSTEHNYVYYAL